MLSDAELEANRRPLSSVADPLRLAALDGLAVLDTPAEARFDDIVRLATRLCATPVALVSLVSQNRQWFKARVGFPHCETDLDRSVCRFVLVEPDLLIIPDLTDDLRTAANPLVTDDPHIRFYAGAPLRLKDGQVVGSLCVIDTLPRPDGLTEEQADDLRALGRQVSDLLDMRRAVANRDHVLDNQQAELKQSRRIDVLAKASQALLVATDPAAVLAPILSANAEILGFDRSYTYDIWPDGHHLRLTHSLNATDEVQEFLRRMPYGAPLCGIVAERRQPLVLADLQQGAEPRFETARGIGLNAYAGFPILSRGSLRGVISFASTRLPTFDDETLSFFETVARLMSAVYERLDGDLALRESDARYRTLFEGIDEGFCTIRFLDGPHGPMSDYLHVEANPAFAHHLGIPNALGQTLRDIIPNEGAESWLKSYGEVLRTGKPTRFEREFTPTGRYLEVAAHRIEPSSRREVAVLFTDITARKRAETALFESEALVRQNIERVQLALAAGAIIGTWFWDIPSDRFTIDEAFARTFGLDSALGREGIPLAQIVATVHPDDQAGLAVAINEAISRGGAYSHEYRVRRADGHYYWIEANGRVDHAPDGTPLSFPGVLLDIEERRTAKEALRESEERFRTILDTVEAAFAIVEVKFDADDRPVDYCFVEANPAFERQAGVNLRGKWVTEFAPDLERFWFETYGHVAKTGEPANFENYAEAFKRWFDVRAVKVGCPKDRRIAILFSDITERRAQQKALNDSETRFRALVNAGAQIIYRMSPDWQEMRALEGAGFLADTDAPNVRWLDAYIEPEDRAAVLAAAEDAIQRKSTFELEHRVRLAAGGHGWVLSRAVPILDERGEILEWFGAASDVTDRKLAEQERDLLQQELSHRMKNVFAMVLSIAGQTLRSVTDRAPVQAFEQRIHALSSAHDVLLRQTWAAAPATAVVEAVLSSAGHADRIDVSGPELSLGPRATLSLSLLLHELATNAAKYGALSVPEGRVSVDWHVEGESEDQEVTFEWTEQGGPPVTPPATTGRKGFGSRLIHAGLVGTGGVDLRYPSSGFQATMRAPLVELQRS